MWSDLHSVFNAKFKIRSKKKNVNINIFIKVIQY